MRNVIEIALKSLFLPKNPKNHPAAGGSAPSVTRLSCIGLYSMGPKLDNFCAKNIYLWFKPPSLLTKNPCCAFGCLPATDRFFKRLYGPPTKRANKRCRVFTSFFQR